MPQRVVDRLKMNDVPGYVQSKTGVTRGSWCIRYWANHGIRSYSNRLTKLRTEKICNQLFTRRSWVDTFLKELEE